MYDEDFKKAFDRITRELRDDNGYYYSWQSNIAVKFQDVLFRAGYQLPDLHKLSNDAAKEFIDLLIGKSEMHKE